MNAFEVIGSFVLNGSQKVSSEIKNVSKNAEVSSKSLKGAAKSTGTLSKGLNNTAKSAEKAANSIKRTTTSLTSFGRGVSKVGDKMSLFVTGPIVAAGAAIVGLGKQFADKADSILDAAAATGLSTDAIQAYAYVARQAGTSTAVFQDSITRINRLMPQFKKGTGAAAEAVQKLGLNSSDFANQNPEKTINDIIMGLQGIPDPAKRAEIGVAIFSKRWEQLAPVVDLGTEAFNKFTKAGQDFAHSNKDLQKANSFRMAIERLSAAFTYAKEQLVIALMPVLTDQFIPILEDSVIPAIVKAIEVIAFIAKGFASLPGPIQSFILASVLLTAALGPMLSIFGRLVVVIARIPAVAALAGAAFKALGALIALVSGPVALAVGLLATAIYLVITSFDDFDKFGREIFGKFKIWIEGIFSDMGINIISTMSALPGELLKVFTRAGEGVMDYLRGFAKRVVKSFRNMLSKIPGVNLKASTSGLASSIPSGSMSDYAMTGAGGRSSKRFTSGGASTTNIDMRNSTFRNGDDLNDRLIRSGNAPI